MKKFKKIMLLLLVLLIVPSAVACDKRPVLRILAPGEYMSDSTIAAFEKA